jgi:4-phytase/acid phosphatase
MNRFTSLLAASLLPIFSFGSAIAQSGGIPVPASNTAPGIPVSRPSTEIQAAEQRSDSGSEGELETVVALFRHGVRAPLKDFADHAHDHSKDKWPMLDEWHPVGLGPAWSDLTEHGWYLANLLGQYYAKHYRDQLGDRFKVFLWADVDRPTRDTADALAWGFRTQGSINVTVAALPMVARVDPLFHPFRAQCGTPNGEILRGIASDIRANWQRWWTEQSTPAEQLLAALACKDTNACTPLDSVQDEVGYCAKLEPKCESPITWKGRFSYVSSVSEAFLLEYANAMAKEKVGWGNIDPPNGSSKSKIQTMLQLHDFYFDKTERVAYLAQIEGSNLVREIQLTINKKRDGCQHAPIDSRFVGLIGHDTNLASVGALLNLNWRFGEAPEDARGLPNNDALPAGALVFELRKRGTDRFVQVYYVSQSLRQMGQESIVFSTPLRLVAQGPECQGQPGVCRIPLDKFNELANRVVKPEFLSRCQDGEQVCR